MNKSATPALYHLFKTREDAIILEEIQDNIYYNFVSNSLFSTNR